MKVEQDFKITKDMTKEAFLCDMEAIEEEVSSRIGDRTFMAIFRLLALYIHYKVGYLDKD